MSAATSFAHFESELNRLVESFGRRLAELKQPGYAEAQLRDDFLNPFFRALGWDMENRAGLIQKEREVEIESLTHIAGGRKRADYLFRTDKRDRFVCEAKKPAEELAARYAFQAKRYAWNKGVPVAVLTDFEELKIFVVGGKPYLDEPHVGEWKQWNFRQFPLAAREIWDLLSRDQVAAGSIDQALEALPKKAKASGKGKAKQQWLIKPDRTRALDTAFLEFLDETRRDLASDLWKNNDHDELLDGNKLTEAVQRVIDRILFLRICEDRDIDTGERLQSIVDKWRKNTGNDDTGRRATQPPLDSLHELPPADSGSSGIRAPKDSLWRAVVRHFRALDRRPPTHVPFFNGNLFKPHFTETLIISDEWLAGFISELSADESPYLFSEIPVEILGSVYERFLGKVVRPHGKGITVEEKPEVRKAGGVYYTPRYIVDYIVEQTCGKLLDDIAGGSGAVSAPNDQAEGRRSRTAAPTTLKDFEKKTAALRFLDPACGSGSFLIRAFERVCEHWQKRLTANLREVVGTSRGDVPARASQSAAGGSEIPLAQNAEAPAGSAQRANPTPEEKAARAAWEKKHRPLCWVDATTNDVHLTVDLKRKILTQNIYGVDLDAAAVEVTQLSLYLKMLENENRSTLERERELFAEAVALLPPLQDNIKCGNSLIASDFSIVPEDLVRVRAFDWPVQFASIMKAGGFDAVIGNPPYGADSGEDSLAYLRQKYEAAGREADTYALFMEKSVNLARPGGYVSMIVPTGWYSGARFPALRRFTACKTDPTIFVNLPYDVFADAWVDTTVYAATKRKQPTSWPRTEQHLVSLKTFPKRQRIQSQSEFEQGMQTTEFAEWFADGSDTFLTYADSRATALMRRLEKVGVPFSAYADIQRGVTPFNLTEKPTHETSLRAFEGTVRRYLLDAGPERYVRFDDTLAEPKPIRYFQGPRLLIRELISRQFQIQAVKATTDFVTNKSMQSALPLAGGPDSNFLLGCFNSRLLSWFFLQKSNIAQRDDFPKIVLKETRSLPFPKIDLKNRTDKARHDKLVALVDKMLGLMPKLHAATAESEKATLQNAVTATDQQIDALVYELYGLTEDEIKLVEGGQ
jgi:hypothetical protein